MPELATEPRRILVIDDNDGIHGDFRKILAPPAASPKLASAAAALFGNPDSSGEQEGPSYELESALQGRDGWNKLQDAKRAGKPFMVAFVDMRMPPGWDGVETIQHLWEVDPNLQVVICSAYSDYSWDEIISKLGNEDHLLSLRKPFAPDDVTKLAADLSGKWLSRRDAEAA